MLFAVMSVRCVNCGGSDTAWPTILALIFAGVAAIIAARSLYIQTAEHRRLRAELEKRADFDLTVRPLGTAYTDVGTSSARLVSQADAVALRFEIGIRNTGERAATHTELNLLVSDEYSDLTWTLPDGVLERAVVPVRTGEQVQDNRPGSVFISDQIERVALRTPLLRFALFTVSIPREGELAARLLVKAQSDDLPDDVEERTKDYVVYVSRT